jgi:hypothetical protein
MVGRAPALLARRAARRAAAVALVAAIAAYFGLAMRLPDLPGLWWEVAFIAFVLSPAVFALVWLALPYRRSRGLAAVGLACLVLAAGAQVADLVVVADFAKVAAMTAIAFWFLTYFEKLSWVVIIALVVPLVDTLSVARGPTNYIVRERPEIFETLSFGFPLPGKRTVVVRWEPPATGGARGYDVFRTEPRERARKLNDERLPENARGISDGAESAHVELRYAVEAVGAGRAEVTAAPVGEDSPAARATRAAPQDARAESEPSTFDLGLPDFLFFTVFLAAAARWRLRLIATWGAMVLSLGATMALALWLDPFGLGGLPALPGIALAFLLPNADILARSLKRTDADAPAPDRPGPERS